MPAEFHDVSWDQTTQHSAQRLIRLALEEDLAGGGDLTSASLLQGDRAAQASFVARQSGVIVGMPLAAMIGPLADRDLRFQALVEDGQPCEPGQAVARMSGRAVDLLTCERTMLNFLGRLSGIASLSRRFVDAVRGTRVQIYDTRKTTPGWRRLEKYAVSKGGGRNHRMGLYDAVLIKDNHLAHAAKSGITPAQAVERAREHCPEGAVIEIEVDTLEQFEHVLPVAPDIVLLDNMAPAELCRAVALRDQARSVTLLEASGGVSLDTVGQLAQSGVDRISVGALTHSSGSIDIGLDWS